MQAIFLFIAHIHVVEDLVIIFQILKVSAIHDERLK